MSQAFEDRLYEDIYYKSDIPDGSVIREELIDSEQKKFNSLISRQLRSIEKEINQHFVKLRIQSGLEIVFNEKVAESPKAIKEVIKVLRNKNWSVSKVRTRDDYSTCVKREITVITIRPSSFINTIGEDGTSNGKKIFVGIMLILAVGSILFILANG